MRPKEVLKSMKSSFTIGGARMHTAIIQVLVKQPIS